jgi:hypothetical protein
MNDKIKKITDKLAQLSKDDLLALAGWLDGKNTILPDDLRAEIESLNMDEIRAVVIKSAEIFGIDPERLSGGSSSANGKNNEDDGTYQNEIIIEGMVEGAAKTSAILYLKAACTTDPNWTLATVKDRVTALDKTKTITFPAIFDNDDASVAKAQAKLEEIKSKGFIASIVKKRISA